MKGGERSLQIMNQNPELRDMAARVDSKQQSLFGKKGKNNTNGVKEKEVVKVEIDKDGN